MRIPFSPLQLGLSRQFHESYEVRRSIALPLTPHIQEEVSADGQMEIEDEIRDQIEFQEFARSSWWESFIQWDHPFPDDIYGCTSSDPFYEIRSLRHDLNTLIFDFEEATRIPLRNLNDLDGIYLLRNNLRKIQRDSRGSLNATQSMQLDLLSRQKSSLALIDKKFRTLHALLIDFGILDRPVCGRRRRRSGRVNQLAVALPKTIDTNVVDSPHHDLTLGDEEEEEEEIEEGLHYKDVDGGGYEDEDEVEGEGLLYEDQYSSDIIG